MANILGINLSELNLSDLLERLDFFLNSDSGHFLVTPNPEILLMAGRDEEYFHILNSADVAIADGFGLILAGLLQGKKIPRITGSDLTPKLLDKAEREQIKTVIINWQGGLSLESDISQTLKSRWPKLIFEVIDTEKKINLSETENLRINNFAPKLIFVTLGAPFQEKLIWHEIKNWPSARLALAVGGSFDFLTGKIKRAPQLMRTFGIEWLWRLLSQPKRFNRIWRATAVFGFKIFKIAFIKPFFYRSNVAIMLYKKTPDGVKILIVARSEDPTHWQIPQGGTDNESLAVAGARELREELGTDKFVFKKTFKNIHAYRFSKRSSNIRHSGYKGQKQGLFIAEYTGDDSDIKLNYWDHVDWKWIDINEIVEAIHPHRQEAMKKFIPKFLDTIK
jgi:N-acetylglucosaminyldiphosphoundecaprenol N-acetyl-beta-D-mannosaminyltransferase